MSPTKFKNAAKVWRALCDLTEDGVNNWPGRYWWTVGEVAKKAGLSKVTTRRYLDMALEEGQVFRVRLSDRYEYRLCDVVLNHE